MTGDAPRYWNQAAIARRFGVDRQELGRWLARWPTYPPPDAMAGTAAPLWLTSTGRAWDRWHARRPVDTPQPRYVGPAEVARHCGVVRSTVSNWLARHPDAIPAPDATVDGRPVWLEGRLPEWQRWARHHASAAGGYRP